MKIKITKNCHCEHDLHEITKYFREGLTVQEFKVGEELEVINEWDNFYGSYYRCKSKSKKGYVDISRSNAELV